MISVSSHVVDQLGLTQAGNIGHSDDDIVPPSARRRFNAVCAHMVRQDAPMDVLPTVMRFVTAVQSSMTPG